MGLLTDAAASTARVQGESGTSDDAKTAFPRFHKAARGAVFERAQCALPTNTENKAVNTSRSTDTGG
jgi:hypothetical protein